HLPLGVDEPGGFLGEYLTDLLVERHIEIGSGKLGQINPDAGTDNGGYRPAENEDVFDFHGSIAPADFRVLLIVHAGDFKSVEALRVIIKKEQVRSGVLQMARVNPLVLSVMNPETIEH